jgi:hypothetical protein
MPLKLYLQGEITVPESDISEDEWYDDFNEDPVYLQKLYRQDQDLFIKHLNSAAEGDPTGLIRKAVWIDESRRTK